MESRALVVEHLSVEVATSAGAIPVLQDVSFAVEAGQCLGIVGESGSGKSLLLRATLGLLPTGVRRTGGSVTVGGRQASAAHAPPRGLAMVLQDSLAALDPTMRIGTYLGYRLDSLDRNQKRARVVDLLTEVDIPDPVSRMRSFPHELSGGQRQRVCIALALARDPEVLLCDEPTTALDVTLQASLLSLLETRMRERRLGMVFVSHDLAVVSRIADVIAVMYAGRIVEAGSTDAIVNSPRHPYTRALLASTTLSRQRGPDGFASIPGSQPTPGDYDHGCRFRARCPERQDDCEAPLAGLQVLGVTHRSACHHDDGPSGGLTHASA